MEYLATLELQPAYHKGQNDIAREFYLPCMERAISYDRAVGFFSSSIYIIAWPSLKSFVLRGGKMRIICSPVLSQNDIDALNEGYSERVEEVNADYLCEEVNRLLNDPFLGKPTRVLATLVKMGVADFRIAFLRDQAETRHKRLFHDKVGIFRDAAGNALVFKGSMNETWSGLAADGNLESVDVFVSWEGQRDQRRVQAEIAYFTSLWENNYPSVSICKFPDIVRSELIKAAADVKEWPNLVDEINRELEESLQFSADRYLGGRIPLPHQRQALKEWIKRDRRGILEHATGSGKTFTALCAIRDALERGEIPIVLVPSRLLFTQWAQEIRETFKDMSPQILLCGAEHNRWRENTLLNRWTKRNENPRVIIATMQTASSEDFLVNTRQGDHIFLVADEVHRLGSPQYRKILSLYSGPRLGLSATPRRAGDPDGTDAIFDYFRGVIPPPFTLHDAIQAKTLTKYLYHIHKVILSDEEQVQWDQSTNKIRQLCARSQPRPDEQRNISSRIKQLLIDRSRIVKGAEGKIPLAVEVLSEHYRCGQRWIVYCDTQVQLSAVLTALRAHDLDAMEYHSVMHGDREQTLRHFELNGGILVSIRCLDEGVNIPAVSHALILASSKNPREFIQRRGRVLRKAPGKPLAVIHDTLVLPRDVGQDTSIPSIVEGEIIRAIEFGRWAENSGVITDLQRIALHFELNYEQILEEGIEDGDD